MVVIEHVKGLLEEKLVRRQMQCATNNNQVNQVGTQKPSTHPGIHVSLGHNFYRWFTWFIPKSAMKLYGMRKTRVTLTTKQAWAGQLSKVRWINPTNPFIFSFVVVWWHPETPAPTHLWICPSPNRKCFGWGVYWLGPNNPDKQQPSLLIDHVVSPANLPNNCQHVKITFPGLPSCRKKPDASVQCPLCPSQQPPGGNVIVDTANSCRGRHSVAQEQSRIAWFWGCRAENEAANNEWLDRKKRSVSSSGASDECGVVAGRPAEKPETRFVLTFFIAGCVNEM